MSKDVIKLYSPKYFATCGLGGILSCGLTHAIVTPLDLVKCNIQANPKEFTGVFQGFKRLRETKQNLFRGWGPTLVGYSAQGLFKYGLYEIFKYQFAVGVGEENANKYKDLLYIGASASAEFFADIALCPFEAVKVRVQTTPTFARGLMDGLPKILREEGMSGLFKGLSPLWARQIPYTIIKFVSFERVVQAIYSFLPKEKEEYGKFGQLNVSFAAGYIAGIICGAVSHPADTMVSMLNKSKTAYPSMMSGISSIYRDIGFMGLWGGFAPRVVMIGTLTGLQWLIYDSFKATMGLPTTGGRIVLNPDDQDPEM